MNRSSQSDRQRAKAAIFATNTTNMKTLLNTYTRNGYTYTLQRRTAYAACYKMEDGDGRFVGYEVGRVKVAKDSTIGGNFIEGGERFWSDEDFGRIASWHRSEVHADIAFNNWHEAGASLKERQEA